MRENTKKPLKCWGCEGPHLRRNCPLENRNEGKSPSTQEVETVGQESGTIPKICAMLEDHQEGHNSTLVEVEGDILEQTIYGLIEPGLTHIYITPILFEMCTLKKETHRRLLLV